MTTSTLNVKSANIRKFSIKHNLKSTLRKGKQQKGVLGFMKATFGALQIKFQERRATNQAVELSKPTRVIVRKFGFSENCLTGSVVLSYTRPFARLSCRAR